MNLKTIALISGLFAVALNIFALIVSTWIYKITEDIPLMIIALSFSMAFMIISMIFSIVMEE